MERQLPTRDLPIKRRSTSPQDNEDSKRPREAALDLLALRSLSESLKILPVPEDTDDLETTARKIEDLAQVVEDGNSLALWTGLKLASMRDPETLAEAQMTLSELELYEEWKRMRNPRIDGVDNDDTASRDTTTTTMKLPEFNWDENKAPVPSGAQSVKKFTQRAAAMDVVWGHQGATAEHAAWLTFNMVHILPLIKAITKLSNIQKHIKETDPLAGKLTNTEAAELETARKVIAITEGIKTREMGKIRKQIRSIHESAAALKSRMQALERRER
ncbi:hypothetical protein BDV25DRAFT_162325 [Aspergillus avenaceus]|uniref:Uncharacterized protein n=1 Tax=Aspergillus avenaceus TaxID=36643 RepID=A0A5N6TJG4_ASPAV|nr:hypothetical protein BDV25DRAFT_162325 [Aspergillus avenaceus]